MFGGPLRWASSEGVFLFQVPDDEHLLSTEIVILLSSSLYAIQIFFNKGQIKFNNEDLNIIKLSFHPPYTTQEEEDEKKDTSSIVHLKMVYVFKVFFLRIKQQIN